MLIEQKFTVQAPAQKVWEFLIDVPRMSACVPGVERVEALDEKSYQGTIRARLGPISASFNGKLAIAELDPPHYLASRGEGMDSRTASRVITHMTMRLREVGGAATEVVVKADVNIAGRLGQFGHGIIQEQAGLLFEEFAACAKAQLEGDHRGAVAVRELNVLALMGRAVRLWFRRLLGQSHSPAEDRRQKA